MAIATAALADGPAYVRPPPAKLILPTAAGDHKLKFTTRIAGRAVTLPYLLHLPGAGVGRQPPPMLVFFHGIGECGTDLSGVYFLGPMTVVRGGANPPMASTWPFAVLCPQCPPHGETWDTDYVYRAATELVDTVAHSGRVDADRVYATGLSMGGLGTWCVAEQAPDLFAAVVPMSAMQWQTDTAGPRLRLVAAWTLTGLEDEPRFVDGNRAMEHALSADAAVTDRFSYLDDGHRVFDWAYAAPQVYEWMLSRHRPTAAERKRLAHSPTTQPMPTAPGHHLLTFTGRLGDRTVQIDYGLYLPRPAAAKPGPRPAMLFLQEANTIGPVYDDVCCHGPDLALARRAGLADRFPLVVVSPRLPLRCDWDSPGVSQLLADLMDHVAATVPIDVDRVSVSGVDEGADAACHLVAALPGRFSAVVWVSTREDASPPGDWESHLDVPGRAFSPTAAVRRAVADAARRAKADWAAGPVAAGTPPVADLPAYADPNLLAWLARQRRPAHR